jgi:hypothetical protein
MLLKKCLNAAVHTTLQVASKTPWCNKDPTTTRKWPSYQPQSCFTFQDDLPGPYHYCPFSMPSWQAYRDTALGLGPSSSSTAHLRCGSCEYHYYNAVQVVHNAQCPLVALL